MSTVALPAPWKSSGMENRNRRFEAPFENFLVHLCDDAGRHSRFLNMLSLLEHMGGRKIMLSQTHAPLGLDVLKHIAEETRHAFFFKRQAEKLSGTELKGFDAATTLSPAAAKMYFGRLDAHISQVAASERHRHATYLWVSLIVELRACWAYRIYQSVLKKAFPELTLKGLLAEEDRHLGEMHRALEDIGEASVEKLVAFSAFETELFGKLFAAIKRDATRLLVTG